MFFSANFPLKSINLFLLILFLSLFACDTSLDNPNTIEFPTKNISYFNHVSPFFDEQCYCHRSGGSAVSTMDISTPTKIEDLYWSRFIFPGDPQASDLYQALRYPDKPPGLTQMPFGQTPVNSNQQDGIRQWILEGAKVDQ